MPQENDQLVGAAWKAREKVQLAKKQASFAFGQLAQQCTHRKIVNSGGAIEKAADWGGCKHSVHVHPILAGNCCSIEYCPLLSAQRMNW